MGQAKLKQKTAAALQQNLDINALATAVLYLDKNGVRDANLSAQKVFNLSLASIQRTYQSKGSPFLAELAGLINKPAFDIAHDITFINGHSYTYSLIAYKSGFICEIHPISKAKDSDADKVKWAAHMLGHELRTPLASIKGISQLLEKDMDDDQKHHFLSLLRGEADRIEGLSRSFDILAGVKKITPKDVNLHEVLESILESLECNDNVITDYDPSLPSIRAEFDLIVVALTNVIKNAIQEIDQKGKIRIKTFFDSSCYIEGERYPIAVSIIDNGGGIAPEILNRIFDPFFTTRPKGQGIGLALVRQILKAHDAEIKVYSSPDETVFKINFPYEKKAGRR